MDVGGGVIILLPHPRGFTIGVFVVVVLVIGGQLEEEEANLEVKNVVRSSRPHHGGWFVVATEGVVEVAVRVEAAVGWEAERSSNNNNGDSSSSNFQRLEQQQQQ